MGQQQQQYLVVAALILCLIQVFPVRGLQYASYPSCPDIFQDTDANKPLPHQTLQLVSNLTRPGHLQDLTRPLIAAPRPQGSIGHEAVRAHLVDFLRRLGWRVEQDAFAAETPVGVKRFANIVATRQSGGASEEAMPQPAVPVVVLAAHYDSAPLPGGKFVGATDSAVSCAIILMLAEALDAALKAYTTSSVQVRVVFFDGEESQGGVWSASDSLYGSRHLASRWCLQDGVNPGCPAIAEISELVLLDLIGAPGPRIAHSYLPGPSHLVEKEARDFARLAAAERRLRASGYLPETSDHPTPFFVPAKPGRLVPLDTVDDDHTPFRRLGVPALHLVPRPFPKVWHTEEDTGKRVHWGHSAAVARILLTWLLEAMQLEP